jgi:hypothetical protein
MNAWNVICQPGSDRNFSMRRTSVSKRIFAILISITVLTGTFGLQAALGQSLTFDPQASKARAKIESLGNNTRVEVKLRDTTKVKGHISAITPDSFTVADAKTGTTNTIAYADVAEVKKPGGGLSTKGWLIIGAAAAGAVITWIVVKPAFCDGGAQTRGIC